MSFGANGPRAEGKRKGVAAAPNEWRARPAFQPPESGATVAPVTEDGTPSNPAVHREYKLTGLERMYLVARFGRAYRPLAGLGAAVVLVAVLSGANALLAGMLFALGLAFLLSFVWLPFRSKFGSAPIIIDATAAGFAVQSGGVTSELSWGAVRRMRRTGHHLALDLDPAGTFPIPLRALRGDELTTLQQLWSTNRGARLGASRRPDEPVLLKTRSDLRVRDAVATLGLRPAGVAGIGLGAILIVGGAATLVSNPGDPVAPLSWAFVAFGLIVATTPVWGALLRVYLGGGLAALTAPCNVEISQSGFWSGLGTADSWSQWHSFESVRYAGNVMVLKVRDSNAEVLLSTRDFSRAELDTLREVLRTNGVRGA